MTKLWIAFGLLIGTAFHWAVFLMQTTAINTATSPIWNSPVAIQIIGFITLVFTTLMGIWSQSRASARADRAALRAEQKAEEVKVTVANATQAQATTLTAIKETGEAVHTLVNSERGTTLALLATAARSLATITNDPIYIKSAEKAESDLALHIAQQAIVDAALGQKQKK